jgi:hypothetical protein
VEKVLHLRSRACLSPYSTLLRCATSVTLTASGYDISCNLIYVGWFIFRCRNASCTSSYLRGISLITTSTNNSFGASFPRVSEYQYVPSTFAISEHLWPTNLVLQVTANSVPSTARTHLGRKTLLFAWNAT